MSVPVVLAIGLLGGLAAIARFLVEGAVAARAGRDFPFGILAVNLTGAFLLGAVVGAALSDDADRLLATGLLGAYTTFSAWTWDSHRLAGDGRRRLAALNFAVSLILGVGAAWLGRRLGAAL